MAVPAQLLLENDSPSGMSDLGFASGFPKSAYEVQLGTNSSTSGFRYPSSKGFHYPSSPEVGRRSIHSITTIGVKAQMVLNHGYQALLISTPDLIPFSLRCDGGTEVGSSMVGFQLLARRWVRPWSEVGSSRYFLKAY
ncbi:hypothetical protein RHGRI_010977 [Rhododendron griersonianum]|uniref:Uncharacterized protein n=1 Tax=Rhododendron griersonianum TaxID=479676 RepID=A0AAV6KLC9_9ERIC|nr:hypothetical protein RHGRI_010977 [Rhododendron griersonianum]